MKAGRGRAWRGIVSREQQVARAELTGGHTSDGTAFRLLLGHAVGLARTLQAPPERWPADQTKVIRTGSGTTRRNSPANADPLVVLAQLPALCPVPLRRNTLGYHHDATGQKAPTKVGGVEADGPLGQEGRHGGASPDYNGSVSRCGRGGRLSERCG